MKKNTPIENCKSICLYFQVHQPFRLNKLNYFDTGKNKEIFSKENKEIFNKVAYKCYHPTNNLLLKLIKKYPEFKVSFSLSGTFLDQCELYDKKLLDSFKKLANNKQVELINETYYHSLAFVESKSEFIEQILMHRKKIWQLFKKKPTVFRNTELIYDDTIGEFARQLGFNIVLAEGWDEVLNSRSPNFVYTAAKKEIGTTYKNMLIKNRFREDVNKDIFLLLKNYDLSDDIAFRFGDRNSKNYPMTAEKFIAKIQKQDFDTINIFIDYETFGEHQWKDTKIFEFLEKLPSVAIKNNIIFKTPTETVNSYDVKGSVSFKRLTSWADTERDLSAWLQNQMQLGSIKEVYALKNRISKLEKSKLNKKKLNTFKDIWRKLQTSDHFYYMSTKYFNDGDIHAYFSPYTSPYDSYINYMNVLNDFKHRLITAK